MWVNLFVEVPDFSREVKVRRIGPIFRIHILWVPYFLRLRTDGSPDGN